MDLPEVIAAEIQVNITLPVEEVGIYGNWYPDTPTTPDTIVSIIDSGGFPPNKYTPIREKVYDFKIRTQTYAHGIDLGGQIFNLFHSKNNYSLGDFYIAASFAQTELTYLFKDSKDRHEFSIEFVFTYKY